MPPPVKGPQLTVVTGTPQEFAAHIRSEIEKWAKIVKSAGIQPE
jgi:tripartite-type tricarboxylate transporter receptor subunit TctC